MANTAKPKNNAKRNNRSNRREAQAALERERQEKAAKERRQQTIIGIVVVAVVLALVAVIGIAVYRSVQKDAEANMSVDEAYSKLQEVKAKPSAVNERGGFLLSKDGVNKKVDGVPTLALYMDPMCPGCQNFDQQTAPTLKALVDAGQANLEIYPLSFLDSTSSDQYSSRASSSILSIASQHDDQDQILDYISNLYASDFKPEEGTAYKSVSDDQLKAQAVKAGIPQSVADKAFGLQYKDWLDAMNNYTPKRPELFNTSGTYKGSMTTPTFTVNGTAVDLQQSDSLGLSLKETVLTSIGLNDSQLGKSGQLPSVGDSGKPVALDSSQS